MPAPRAAAPKNMVSSTTYPARSRLRLAAGLLGLSLGVVLALWYGQTSRWLVRLQASLAVPMRLADATPPELSPFAAGGVRTPESEAAFRRAAEDMHEDGLAQVAWAVRRASDAALDEPPNALGALTPLTLRYSRDRNAILAAALRHAAGANMALRRPELTGLSDTLDRGPLTLTAADPQLGLPADLSVFESLARKGEAGSPNNGFFAAMRAAALYAEGRDAPARDALARAARAPVWGEYITEEVRGAWRLGDRALGKGNTMVRAGILASFPLSHYTVLKDTARLAALQAMRLELAGKGQQGSALRRDLLLLGSRMRAQSTTFVGSSTGAAIQDIAISRPFGAPTPHGKSAVAQRRAAFVAYLERTGHRTDIPWVKAQFAARDEMWRVESAGFSRFDISQGLITFGQWVVAGLVFLDSALWVLFFGVLAALFVRLGSLNGPPTRHGVTWQAGATAVVVFSSTLFWFLATQLTTAPRALIGAVGVAVVGVLVWLAASTGWRGLLRALLVAAGTLPIALLLAAIVLWLGRGFAAVGPLLTPNVAAAYTARDTAPGLAALGLVVAMAVAAAVALVARVRHEPLLPGMLRGYAAAALPVACALILVYGGIAVRTVRMSVGISNSLSRMIEHEGRFYADLAGRQWPE